MSLSNEPNNSLESNKNATPLSPAPPVSSNSKSSMVSGIILGIGITIMVGLGTCAFILSAPSFSIGSSAEERQQQQQQNTALDTLVKKATSPNADAKSLWVYTKILQNDDLRQRLHIAQSTEQSQQLIQQYLTQSANKGQKEAMLELGDILLAQSLTKSADDSINYASVPVTNPNQLDTAINWYIKAYQQGCDFMRLDTADSTDLLRNLAGYDNLPIGGSLDRSIMALMDNPAIANQPELRAKIASLILKSDKFCYADRQSLKRDLIEHLATTDSLSSSDWQQDYVIAKFIDEPDLNYLQRKKIPSADVVNFDNQTQLIYDRYVKLFGKPTFDDTVASAADMVSVAASTASVAR